MPLNIKEKFDNRFQGFNMTPLIDIVFLLMIFFLVVCRFIEAENFEISVTDNCQYAQDRPDNEQQAVTVTVMKAADNSTVFAVGPEIILPADSSETAEKITALINSRLEDTLENDRTVVLRIDKDISFADAQYALEAVSQSETANIQLAVLKEKVPAASTGN